MIVELQQFTDAVLSAIPVVVTAAAAVVVGLFVVIQAIRR